MDIKKAVIRTIIRQVIYFLILTIYLFVIIFMADIIFGYFSNHDFKWALYKSHTFIFADIVNIWMLYRILIRYRKK